VVKPAVYPRRLDLAVEAYHVHGEPIPPSEAVRRQYVPFAVGDGWGGMWDTSWFRFTASVPDEWEGQEVAALIHLGGDDVVGFSAEGLIWDRDLAPRQGLHHRHREFVVARHATAGERIELYVEAAANPIPKWHRQDWPLLAPDYHGPPLYVLRQGELVTVDRRVGELYADLRLLIEMARRLPEHADAIVTALDRLRAAIETGGVAAAADRAELGQTVLGRPSALSHRITAVGHAHIDSAWLWPVRETKRKCARTFANQVRLMERYPDHHFACSQAVQYQWVKDGYPAIYEEMRKRVAEGRWEPVGGMWVEPDTNIPSGESLVRQFVWGQRFFADEFGIECHELWIPDAFGYSAALPQIAAQAGVTALVTQKMSWNDTNVFPHSTFWWEGHDGSRLLAHFPPSNTYNGDFSVRELLGSVAHFRDGERSDRSLYPFGYGDGGGGPTDAMLERAGRVTNLEGLPPVRIGSVAGFLADLAEDAAGLATWVGELYLETHRGTLTTHADVKRWNRRGEEALRAAEMWSVAAGLDRRRELEAAWKLFLLQQFHDILPGSSIHWVYEDAAGAYAEVLEDAGRVGCEAQAAVAGMGDQLVAFNSSSYDRTELVELPDGQVTSLSLPACGWGPVAVRASFSPPPVEVAASSMENGHLRVAWDSDGLLTSVWDKVADREVLAAGRRGNRFQLHEDHPKAFDAWNVDIEYLDQVTDLDAVDSIEVVERDSWRGGVRFVRRFGGSTISQTMRLASGSRRLEFHTEVDWHERHRFLKVAFPVAIRAGRATYEIQHGHIERPTVANTSWDVARFEVCGHRWADLSEPGYGVALLNDGKYGYDIRGNVMRLSLLRGPGYPDPEADQGLHHFAYALLPHPGDLRADGRVVEEAEFFNLPIV
ncbi:MAG TPA: glycoside hydrolase family 38 C-terminal domain-containing protein, partial [Acidimicrobiales bacterium]|nr:glycoside hydrolase family 38 C-terminal domain-containing protein [Acidimicrobiales bacterium]